MPATTTLLGLVTPTQGTLSGTWGDTVNYGISDYVDISVAGTLTLTNDGAVTLANTTGSSAGSNITSTLTGAGTVTAQFAIVRVTGTLTVAKVVTGPSYSKTYTVVNAATGGIVTFKASGQTGVSIAVGETAFVYYNGTDYVKVVGTATAGAAGGSTTQVQYNNAGVLAGITGATTNGTALTLVAPILGTPASATLTNATGLPISTGVSGLGSGVATFLATPSSANLAAAVTDETGSGALVFATSPTLVTPALGTPSSGTVTNLTGTASININGTVGATTATTGAFTTLTASSTLTVTGAGSIEGLTVGRGAGAVSTNTAVGASALAGSNTGGFNTAVGSSALLTNTTGINNTATGLQALKLNTTGSNNTATGLNALEQNTTGGSNTAIGLSALQSNTTASNNTAVGYQAGFKNTSGTRNTFLGVYTGFEVSTGQSNTYVGYASGPNGTASTGSYNTAVGDSSLFSNTTASNNTAVGYQAGYTYTGTTGYNTFYGWQAGTAVTTGSVNTYIGPGAGNLMTSGAKNTILGAYNGNSFGLDIRTSSNYIVLSDGDGNPRGYFNNSGNFIVGPGFTVVGDSTAQQRGRFDATGSPYGYFDYYYGATRSGYIIWDSTSLSLVNLSDYRKKENIVGLTGAIERLQQLKPRKFNFISDPNKTVDGFVAHELGEVVPQAVFGEKDAVDESGNPVYQAIDQSKIIPLLTAAIQEQQAIIESLKARLDAANL